MMHASRMSWGLLTHDGKPYRIIEGRPARRPINDIFLVTPLAEDLSEAGDPVELPARDCTPAVIDLAYLARTGERRLYRGG